MYDLFKVYEQYKKIKKMRWVSSSPIKLDGYENWVSFFFRRIL